MTKSVIVEHARSDGQREVLEQIIADGICPFCRENLLKYHKNPIVVETSYWIVTENQWPYEHSRIQILLIAKRHVENFSELTPEELADFIVVAQQAAMEFGVHSGALCMRFGDPLLSGASVRHLHAQLIMPDDDGEPIRYKIGSTKK